MPEESVSIEYRIRLGAESEEVFEFELDSKTFDLISKKIPDPPEWTELTYRQCSHCPLNNQQHSHCPLALQIYGVVDRFHNTRSIDEVEIEVVTEERRVIQKLPIQSAIASMLDLTVPICGCPKTAHLKPLARFHLPLASEEETVFRVTGMYLLAQYFVNQAAKNACIEFDGLTKIYEDLHILNAAVASRLQHATKSDSVKNAITLLDMYSLLVPALLEDQLVEMRAFFEAYLPIGSDAKVTSNHLEKAKAFRLELVPLDSELDAANQPPDWLKEVTAGKESETEKSEESAEASEAVDETADTIDEILGHSHLKMDLVPLDGEMESEAKSRAGSDKNKPGRATFKLADD